MLATLAEAPLVDAALVYEPKYDGIRAVADVDAGGRSVHLWSRLGNEKTSQFPEIVAALAAWAKRRREPVVLDGEIVALDGSGDPIGFQNLQGRIHLGGQESRGHRRDDPPASAPTALIAFDLLREGRTDYRDRPLLERRAELERLFARTGSPMLRISEMVRGDGRRSPGSGFERLRPWRSTG